MRGTLLRFLLTICLLLGASAPAVEDAFFTEQASLAAHDPLLRKEWQDAIARRDVIVCLACLKQAADKGNILAKVKLGQFYDQGCGVAQDHEAAISLIKGIVDSNANLPAVFYEYLASLYDSAKSLPHHDELYIKWLRVAEQKGSENAPALLGIAYYMGNGVQKDEHEALKWLNEGLARGSQDAIVWSILASIYHRGPEDLRDMEKALLMYNRAAEAGNVSALNAMGNVYFYGDGVPQDKRRAFELYKQAADKGSVAGKFNVAQFYHTGSVVKQDEAEALRLYREVLVERSADDTFAVGVLEDKLGDIYRAGRGVKKDMIQAIGWYSRAVAKGDIKAHTSMAELYGRELQIEPDHSKAEQMLREAAEKGNVAAQVDLAWYYSEGAEGAKSPTMAYTWMKIAADRGNSAAEYNMGKFYDKGIGCTPDARQAFEWYLKAAEHGNADAMQIVGSRYYLGRGVSKDLKKAYEWCAKAAEIGYPASLCALADFYFYGEGVQRDVDKALSLYKQAMEKGNPDAIVKLGMCYFRGDMREGSSVVRSYAKAIEYFRAAAEQKSPMALFNLAACYHDGLGVEIDRTEAAKLFAEAAKLEYIPAVYWLGICYLNGDVPGATMVENRRRAKQCFARVAQADLNGTVDVVHEVNVHDTSAKSLRAGDDETRKMTMSRQYSIGELRYKGMACYMLGLGYEDGIFEMEPEELNGAEDSATERAKARAFEFYRQADEINREVYERMADTATPAEREQMRQHMGAALLALSHCYEKGLGVEKSLSMAQECKQRWVEIVGPAEEEAKLNLWKYAYGLCFAGGLIAELPDEDDATECIETTLSPLCPALGSFIQFMIKCRARAREWVNTLTVS